MAGDKELPTPALGKAEVKDDKKKDTDKMQVESDGEDEDDTQNRVGRPNNVIVHPLVLLSVVDHFNRVARDTKKRVVGILLGEVKRGQIDVTNSYAVPFEEDLKDPSIWFLDHNYHESMLHMFKKVNAKEKVVGWYSTGPKIRPADAEINELIRRYTTEPVLVIVDVDPKDDYEIPTKAYVSQENTLEQQQSGSRRTFLHIPSEIGAYDAEEVGVEHLLRDIRNITDSTLSDQVASKHSALMGLQKRMSEMNHYLQNVLAGRLPPNPAILNNMQDIFNLSPNLKVERLVKAFATKTNDSLLVVYISSLIRSILALHNLINNKVLNREWEADQDKDKSKEKRDAEAKKKAEEEEAKAKMEEEAKETEKDGKGKKKGGKDEKKADSSDKKGKEKEKEADADDDKSKSPRRSGRNRKK